MFNLVCYLKIVLEFSLSLTVAIVDVPDYHAMFQECYPRTDINGVLQVVATNQDCGLGLLVVFLEKMFNGALTA